MENCNLHLRVSNAHDMHSQNNQVYRDARRIYKGGTPDFDLDGWLQYVDDRRSADPGLSDIGQIQAQKLAEYLHPHLTNQASRPVRFVISPMRRTIETIVPTLEALAATDSADACDVMINGEYSLELLSRAHVAYYPILTATKSLCAWAGLRAFARNGFSALWRRNRNNEYESW